MALTYEQIYQAITGQDAEFIADLARTAIETATEVQCDMWSDDQECPVPSEDSIREFAASYTEDCVGDFSKALIEAINQRKFELQLTLAGKVV